MGANWYYIEGFYGYEIKTCGSSLTSIVKKLIKLKEFIDKTDEPFQIAAILSEFHSRMEGMSDYDYKDLYEHKAIFIIGFTTTNDLSLMMKCAEWLKEYITNKPFNKLTLSEKPEFFYGINEIQSIYDMYYYDNDSESSDSDDNSDLEDEENEEDEENKEDVDTSYDECKVVPITEMTKCTL